MRPCRSPYASGFSSPPSSGATTSLLRGAALRRADALEDHAVRGGGGATSPGRLADGQAAVLS